MELPSPENQPTPEELREKFKDPRYLPTRDEVMRAFSVDCSKEWRDFIFDPENPTFEILTEEYINALADYIIERVQEYRTSPEKSFTILEIGAGNGRLSHFLQQKIEEKLPGQQITIIATDSGEWNINVPFPVEQLDAEQALTTYTPDMVLCSWMPLGIDFSEMIRQKKTQEYILIGDSEACGKMWETWGIPDEDALKQEVPPYEADGYIIQHMRELRKLQISRTTSPLFLEFSDDSSTTVVFRRQ